MLTVLSNKYMRKISHKMEYRNYDITITGSFDTSWNLWADSKSDEESFSIPDFAWNCKSIADLEREAREAIDDDISDDDDDSICTYRKIDPSVILSYLEP